MNIFYFIFILIGIYTAGYSFFEMNIHSFLFFNRDISCIEEYKKKEKVTDVISVTHNLAFFFFGIIVFLFGLSNFVTVHDISIKHLVLISSVLSAIDVLSILIIDELYDLQNTKNTIINKWKTEKTFGDKHDHEVNMVRAVKRFDTYKNQSMFSLVTIFLILILV